MIVGGALKMSHKGKILYIDPIGKEFEEPELVDYLQRFTEYKLDYTALDEGGSNLEYMYFEAIAIPEILQKVKWAEENGYDGVIIGCFYDPGLYEAREITDSLTVVAPGESSMNISLSLGYKFSIIAGSEKFIPIITENIKKYGHMDKLASIKVVDLSVETFRDSLELTEKRVKEKSKEAVDNDMAEVLLLGCTAQYGIYEKIQEYTNVPVLDPIIASLKYCEFLIDIRKNFGWSHSKRCFYKSPQIGSGL